MPTNQKIISCLTWILLFSGCGGSQQIEEPTVSPTTESVESTEPLDHSNEPEVSSVTPTETADGVRARLAHGTKGRDRFDSWTELTFRGAESDALALCAAYVELAREDRLSLKIAPVSGIETHCRNSVLESVPRPPGTTYLLGNPREINTMEILLTMGSDETLLRNMEDLMERVEVTAIQFDRFDSLEACERRRAYVEEMTGQFADLGNQQAERFRVDELRRAEQRASEDCQRAQETRANCSPPSNGGTTQGNSSSTCQIELERLERSCATAREIVEGLREGASQLPVNPPAPQLECFEE